jgi:cytochrome c oxidase cbb3-type subunit 1
VAIPHPGVLVLAALLWNVAVTAGVLGILAGDGRAFEFLEFSQRSMKLLFAAYCLVAVWGVVLFLNRRPGHAYVSTSYLVASLLWFPWLLGIANVMLGRTEGVRGVMQAIVGAWYAQNLLGLWLGGLGLGTIYYLIPKIIGRPIHSYYLASFGFWTFAVFSVWTGLQRLNGGPVPAWMVTTSIVAAIMMVVPVTTVTVNFVATLRGSFDMVHESPTLCFVFYGAIAYTLANLVFLAGSFRIVSAVTQFTWFSVAENQLFTCAFFSMVMFGAMYYIVPRLLGREWLSGTLIKLHYWGVGYGFAASIILLIIAGVDQGLAQSSIQLTDPADPHADFMLSVYAMLPLLRGRSIAQLPLFAGELFFAVHFGLMLFGFGRASNPEHALSTPAEANTGGANL